MQAKMQPSWQSVEDVKHVVEQARHNPSRVNAGHFNEDDYMDGMISNATAGIKSPTGSKYGPTPTTIFQTPTWLTSLALPFSP